MNASFRIAVAGLLAASLSAADVSVRWKDLAPLVTGKRVWLPLNDGNRLAGTVRVVEPTALQLEVVKTSDRKAYPKGLVSIPRPSVSMIRVNRPAGHKGIIIGGVIGGVIGGGIAVAAGGVLLAIRNNEGGTEGDWIIATAIVAPIAVGLGAGWLADSASHHGGKTIRILGD